MRSLRFPVLVLALAMAVGVAAASDLDVRVFTVEHGNLSDAARTIEGMLSAEGSLTVQPALRRLTVQDRHDVVERVARFVERFDTDSPEFRVRISLFRATNGRGTKPRVGSASRADAALLKKLSRMFHYTRFDRLGRSVVRGTPGGEVGARLGDRYRVAFTAKVQPALRLALASIGRPAGSSRTPAPSIAPTPRPLSPAPACGSRFRLEQFRLLAADGDETRELVRTTLLLAPGQSIILGAAPSEDAETALVLVVEALGPAEE